MALEPKLERPRIGDAAGLKQIHHCLDQSFEERVIRDGPIQSKQDFSVVCTDDLNVLNGWLVLDGFLETIPFLMHTEERDRSLAQ